MYEYGISPETPLRGGLKAAWWVGRAARRMAGRNGNGHGIRVNGFEGMGTKTAKVFFDWEMDLAGREKEL